MLFTDEELKNMSIKEIWNVGLERYFNSPEKHKQTFLCFVISYTALITTWCLLFFL